MTIITIRDLSTAIAKQLNLEQKEAERYAQTVIDFFGFEDRIIDNLLTQEERQLFYRLQEKGLLSSQREETTLPSSGHPWRTHYWCLERKFILRICHGKTPQGTLQQMELKREPEQHTSYYEEIYRNVPSDLWGTRKLPAA